MYGRGSVQCRLSAKREQRRGKIITRRGNNLKLLRSNGEHFERFQGFLPESRGRTMALLVLYVPPSPDSGGCECGRPRTTEACRSASREKDLSSCLSEGLKVSRFMNPEHPNCPRVQSQGPSRFHSDDSFAPQRCWCVSV